jgi:excisionase family DNA binding protein
MFNIQDLKLYTIQEVAPILGITTRTLYTYIKAGKFTAKKIGGKWKITGDKLKEWVESADTVPTPRVPKKPANKGKKAE